MSFPQLKSIQYQIVEQLVAVLADRIPETKYTWCDNFNNTTSSPLPPAQMLVHEILDSLAESVTIRGVNTRIFVRLDLEYNGTRIIADHSDDLEDTLAPFMEWVERGYL